DASCTPRAVLLARHLQVAEAEIESWVGGECRVKAHRFTVQSAVFPGLGVSSHTPQEVIDFLREQGYPTMMCAPEDVPAFALYLVCRLLLEKKKVMAAAVEDPGSRGKHFCLAQKMGTGRRRPGRAATGGEQSRAVYRRAA